MNAAERRTLAEHLTGQRLAAGPTTPPAPRCEGARAGFDFEAQPDSQGWGVTHDNQRYFDADITSLTAEDLPEPIAEPDETALRAFHEDNADAFTRPESKIIDYAHRARDENGHTGGGGCHIRCPFIGGEISASRP